jgi:glycerate-2-kinase
MFAVGAAAGWTVNLMGGGGGAPAALAPSTHAAKLQALRADGADIFRAAVDSVAPGALVRSALRREGDTLTVHATGKQFQLNKNVLVLGFGKAVIGMVAELDRLLGECTQV